MALAWCCWCKTRPTSIFPIVTRSAAWDKLATNADGDFSCKRCWRCVLGPERCSGAWRRPPFVRIPAPDAEQRSQRRKRDERETDVWMRQVSAIGTPEPGSVWVHVGDRGADMFPFFQACQATQTHFLVRAGKSRRVQGNEDELMYSLTRTPAFASQASRPFEVPAQHGHQARSTQLQLAFGQMTLLPPRNEPRASKDPVTVWVIRVWEEQARDAEEPLEWILLTSVPTTTLEQAWERVDWYGHRWLVEDYHQCLKSGCRIEERQLQTVDGLMRLLGLLSPLAVRLLQVRACAREDPARPAYEVIEPLMLAVLAERTGGSPLSMTVGTFSIEVARLGGYLARSHDGPPGWRTIWKGWLSLQTLVEGAHLLLHLRL